MKQLIYYSSSLVKIYYMVFYLFILLLSQTIVQGQDTLTVMTYNVLRFSGGTSRGNYFRRVIDYVQPDVVILNELQDRAGLSKLLKEAFNHTSTEYAAGSLPASSNLNNGIIYRRSRISLIGQTFLPTVLRHINGYTLVIKDAHENVPQFTIFTAHLKASDGSEYESQRWLEAKELAKYIEGKDDSYYYIMGGDFNIYGPDEMPYKLFTDSLRVDLVDPLWDEQKPWRRNESAFSGIYTQSTRADRLSDGGASGGLDDRFDFLLFSHQFISKNPDIKYLDGSYKAIGNDARHFNTSLINGANTAVPDSIATALYFASDHLPVIAKIVYTTKTSTSPVAHAGSDQNGIVGEIISLDGNQSYDPNGSIISQLWELTEGPWISLSDSTLLKASFTIPQIIKTAEWTFRLTVTDNEGESGTDYVRVKAVISGGIAIYDIQYTAETGLGDDCYPSSYAGQIVEVSGIVTAVRPEKNYPNFFIQDPARSEWAGLFVYVNQGFKAPVLGDEVMLKGSISEYYGLTEIKNIQKMDVLSSGNIMEAVTITASILQSGCTVWGEPMEGMLVRLVGVIISQTANQYNEWLVSDWSGSCLVDDYLFDGVWPVPELGEKFVSIKGVVTYSFGEYKLMPRNNADFNEPITATGSELPEHFNLLTHYPNPFNPSATVEFQLEKGGPVSLKIYDLRGREISVLVEASREQDVNYRLVWNGRDSRGEQVPAGVYFIRMVTGNEVFTSKMLLIR